MSNLTTLFDQIQLQDLIVPQPNIQNTNLGNFLQIMLSSHMRSPERQFFMDLLSYGAFVNSEQNRASHLHDSNPKCAFKSFKEFSELFVKSLEPQNFNEVLERDKLIHRITCTAGALYYQIQVYLQKCTFLYELITSGGPLKKINVENDFIRTLSRIPINRHRAKVILALADPKIAPSKRETLEEAYQATRS